MRGSPGPPKRVKRKLPIGASGTTGTTVFRRPVLTEEDSASGVSITWPAEDEGEVGQNAEARNRVDRALERLFEQRGVGGRFADRLAAGALIGGEFERSQMLPRWRWSISKALGRVTATDLMLASPGRVLSSIARLGSLLRWVALWPPSWVIDSLRLEGQREAVDRLERRGEADRRALVADPFGGDGEGGAVGRVDHEVWLVDVDLDFAHADRDAADDLGDGF